MKFQKHSVLCYFIYKFNIWYNLLKLFVMITITIKTLKFDAGEKLSAFVEKKVSRLEKFCEGKTDKILVSLENLKEGKSAKIQIAMPGDSLVIERKADTFENAVTASVDAMKERISRSKNRKDA